MVDSHVRTILALSGSLRASSSNGLLLRVASNVAPPNVTFDFYDEVGALPHFNPDIDTEEADPDPVVSRWRQAVRSSDGIVISCPEYAHGVPGSFKNALDWLVSSADMMDKPVILLNASSAGGKFAQSSVAETLRMIGANVLEEHSRLEPFLPPGFLKDPTDQTVLDAIRQSISGLLAATFPTVTQASPDTIS